MQWVFPYTYNFLYPINPPDQVHVDASLTPPGYPPAPASTALALLTAYDTPQPYSAGRQSGGAISVGQQTTQNAGVLSGNGQSFAIPCGGAATVGVVASSSGVVAGTVLVFEGTIDDVNWQTVPVYDTTQTQWLRGDSSQGALFAGVANQLIAATSGLSQVRLRTTGWGIGQPNINVLLRATPGAALAPPVGAQPSRRSMPVVIASDESAISVNTGTIPAPGDTILTGPFALALAAGASGVLIPAVAGLIIYIIAFNFHVVTAVNCNLNLESGLATKLVASLNTASVVAAGWNMGGLALPVGESVRIRNTGAVVAGNIYGNIIAVQK